MAHGLVTAGIPVVFLRHTDLMESAGVENKVLKATSVYVRIMPNHLSNPAAKHQAAFAWWTRTARQQLGDPARVPQFHTPRSALLAMCVGQVWYEQTAGLETADVSQHVLTERSGPPR